MYQAILTDSHRSFTARASDDCVAVDEAVRLFTQHYGAAPSASARVAVYADSGLVYASSLIRHQIIIGA